MATLNDSADSVQLKEFAAAWQSDMLLKHQQQTCAAAPRIVEQGSVSVDVN
jgi:hypothetical protein